MAGFVDVVLRGLALLCASLALGGVAWTRIVLRAEPYAKPDAPTRLALRVVAASALGVTATQAALMVVALGALADAHGAWPVALYLETSFARMAVVRGALGVVVAALAVILARRPAGARPWHALTVTSTVMVAASALLSHAVARVDDRALLVIVDAVHQVAAAVWVGGLAHLVIYAASARRAGMPDAGGELVQRFSRLALTSVVALTVAGIGLTIAYVGDPAALVGTAYGVMIVSKVVLFAGALAFAAMNFGLARQASAPGGRLGRYVEIELGLAITVLFAAASLPSLPPAADVREDRATVAEVGARFVPTMPRLVSPPVAQLNRTADPLMAPPGRRLPIERAWSEDNHHWAGFVVVVMGLLAIAERMGARWARHWPLGPTGFWESLALPDVLQHRIFVGLIIVFGVFEWAARTGRLDVRWSSVFPLLCAVGGGLLLTHSHAMFNLKDEFLTEVTHAPLGILGAFAGWARWLELRWPPSAPHAGWMSTLCFTAVGGVLLVYREG